MGAPQYEQAGADVAGSGTTNTIPRWTGPSTLGDSIITQSGTNRIGVTGAIWCDAAGGVGGVAFGMTDSASIRQTGTNAIMYFDASTTGGNGQFVWRSGNSLTERARIDSAGRFGIGTSSPDSTLHVLGAASSQLRIGFSGLSQNYYDAGDHFFRSAGGVANRMSITSSFVDVSFAGYGLKLPATPGNTNPNTLDAYVDGGTAGSGGATFTATLKGLVSDPTTPVTATGKYILVGKLLVMTIVFSNVNTTGAAGAIYVQTNLAAALRPERNCVGAVTLDSIATITGVGTHVIANTGGDIYVAQNTSNAAVSFCTHNAGAARGLTLTVSYMIP